MNRPAFSIALASSLVLACGEGPRLSADAKPEPSYAFLDADEAAPRGTPAPALSKKPSSAEVSDPSDCRPGTGKRADGSCVRLATRDAGHAQQVLLPSGRFVMGMLPLAHDGAAARSNPAVQWPYQPPRLAEVQSFWIDLHEVRRDQYAACVSEGECTPARCPDGSEGVPTMKLDAKMLERVPQTCVSFDQAQSFCSSKGMRLPTEAEWEYAARGPDGRTHPWGEEVRDEVGAGLIPVGMPVDSSYFSLLGFGSSGAEWTGDLHRPDRGLDTFVSGSFRLPDGPVRRKLPDGPVAREEASWWERHRCADPEACSQAPATRHVIKGPLPGRARAAFDATIESKVTDAPATMTVEGWDEVHAHASLSFRCAADRREEDPQLSLPEAAPEIPYTAAHDGLQVFGAVAEAVSQAEAKAFCGLLTAPDTAGETQDDWRLPTRAELLRLAPVFRGPGPFWTRDGGMQQEGMAWVQIEAKPDEALIARCIRG